MKQQLKLSFIVGILFLITACENDKNEVINKTSKSAQSIVFSMNGAPFNDDIERGTRAVAISVFSQRIDIGNNVEAEISIERDAPQSNALTRVITSGNRYTIVAFKAGTAQKVAESKGYFDTVTGNFRYDTDSKIIQIEPGNYDFVCYTHQYASCDGNTITVSLENAGNAFIGRKNNITITKQKRQEISFTMKHVGARVRTKAVTLIAAEFLIGTLASPVGISANYNMQTGEYKIVSSSKPTVSHAFQNYDIAGTAHDSNLNDDVHTLTNSDYLSVLPGTKSEQISFALYNGKIYGKEIHMGTEQLKAGTTFEANGSYTIIVKFMPKFQYLFEDGITGYLSDNNRKGHIPVALVYAPHRGIALWDAKVGTVYWGAAHRNEEFQENRTAFESIDEALRPHYDDNGFNLTWETETDKKGMVKAAEVNRFPTFYSAGHFYQTVLPGKLPAGKSLDGNLNKDRVWFLPSMVDWKKMIETIGLGSLNGGSGVWNGKFLNYAFKRANGTFFDDGNIYWSSTERLHRTSDIKYHTYIIQTYKDYMLAYGSNKKRDSKTYVRPFVAF